MTLLFVTFSRRELRLMERRVKLSQGFVHADVLRTEASKDDPIIKSLQRHQPSRLVINISRPAGVARAVRLLKNSSAFVVVLAKTARQLEGFNSRLSDKENSRVAGRMIIDPSMWVDEENQ